jgi:NAD+ synthase (glutamine-hydrolysing)
MALGLWDYLRKSRSHGFVVSLSGGADSSAVAVLCSLMVRLVAEQLGLAGLKARLDWIDGLQELKSEREVVGNILTSVYQSTRNSSQVTRQAARSVAQAVGASFLEWDVDPLVQQYCQIIGRALGRPLTWERDDTALQNIQARARGPGVWMLANVRRALLLATSNRSEAAVGYATMDGDTCGGLSPIAGIDKAFLRQWLQWMERRGPHGLSALPELAAVNDQAPTAELRPLECGQTDEADLMPYPLLDAIERAAIRDGKDPVDVYQLMRSRYADLDDGQLRAWIDRFFQLWSRNQWKRERYAPSFHVDDENLDPKTWCRFPILSGGYQAELEDLRRTDGAGKKAK